MNLEGSVRKIKEYIRTELVVPVTYNTFYKDIELVEVSGNRAVFYSPLAGDLDLFSRMDALRRKLERAIRLVCGQEYVVEVVAKKPVLWSELEAEEDLFDLIVQRWNDILLYVREYSAAVSQTEFRRFYTTLWPVSYENDVLLVMENSDDNSEYEREKIAAGVLEHAVCSVLRCDSIRIKICSQREKEGCSVLNLLVLRKGFSLFRVNNNNQAAYIAVYTLAKTFPQIVFELIYLYGPQGCGKSHLAQAMVAYVQERDRDVPVGYLLKDSDKRGNMLIRAYSEYPMLIVDNIESLELDSNTLRKISLKRYRDGKQTIIISQYSPGELKERTRHDLIDILRFGMVIKMS